MPELNFKVASARPAPHAASPLLNFSLEISESNGAPIQAIVLRCQIRIEAARRRYDATEQERLLDLFGEPSRWGQTLKTMLWTHAAVVVPPFTSSTVVDLPVPCSFDFNIAASKFFYALEDDEVPLSLLFSGTVFHEGPDQTLQIAQIPWEKEAEFRLPVSVWKQMMELYYPNSAWLCLRKDAFDQLYQYKSQCGLPSWEAALEKLLETAATNASP